VDEHIHFQKLPFEKLHSRYEYGYVICNPPYGERMGELHEAEDIYRQMRQVFKDMPTWSFFVLTSHLGFEKIIGRSAAKKRKLYNGRIQCNLYQYQGPEPPKKKVAD
jgi:putative N6-adenine-specific DNA methylase